MLFPFHELAKFKMIVPPVSPAAPHRSRSEEMQQRVQSGINLLLESLSEANRKRLRKLMEPVGLPRRAEIFKSAENPRYAYFVTSGMISVVLNMADGVDMEIGVIGSDGLSTWLHLLGPLQVQAHAFVQIEGTALRMPMADLRREFESDRELRNAILGYAQLQGLVGHQLIACNRKHSVEQRLARWLLMVQDRCGTDTLPLTQEFLAEMLGSRRTSVGTAVGQLVEKGLIESQRGNIHILSTAGLRRQSCECANIVDHLFRKSELQG